MMNSKYLIPASIVIAFLLILGSMIVNGIISLPEKKEAPPKEELPQIIVTENDHIRGNFEAPVTIVEFSDFQCPFCQRFHPTMKQITADYPDQVRWVLKHFPLDSIHPEARPAAEASECVSEQKGNDGFWQFADAIFENQQNMGDDFYLELAGNLNVDIDQFKECLASGKYQNKVQQDLQEGLDLGVTGTPGNFINGRAVKGAQPYETVSSIIDEILSEL